MTNVAVSTSSVSADAAPNIFRLGWRGSESPDGEPAPVRLSVGARSLVAVQGFDIKAIMRTVGPQACSRGLSYAENGAVESVIVEEQADDSCVLFGVVHGHDLFPYDVTVYTDWPDADHRYASAPYAGARPDHTYGECSCPMGINCKHVAAVMFAAGPAIDQASTTRSHQAEWEKALSLDGLRTRAGGHLAQPNTEPLALLIEPRHSAYGHTTFGMRPMRLGTSGRWVRSGVSWRDLRFSGHHFPAAAVDLLEEIASLDSARRTPYGYGSDADAIDLARFPSKHIWDALAEASTARLPIVSSASGQPVGMTSSPANAALEVRARGGDWIIDPTLAVAGEKVDGNVTLLGDPAHGIAWLSTTGGDPVLHLARLSGPLDAATKRILAAGEPITVPKADQGRFVRDFLPALRQRLEVTSPDGSVELPVAEPGRLVLSVADGDGHGAELRWWWRYAIGDEVIESELNPGHHPEIRDFDAESSTAAAALDAVGPLRAMTTQGLLGTGLAPTARLTGPQALTLQREVVPALQSLDDVDVEITPGALDLREASDAPVVSVASAGEVEQDWLDLQVTVTVDGEEVPFAELFRALATDQEFLILPSGTYFSLDRAELQQLRSLIEESWALAESDGNVLRVGRYEASFFAELERLGVLDEQARAWSASIRELTSVSEIPEPAMPVDFDATLRPYQKLGYTWLSFLYDHQLGGVLADDMGLGKTLQALAMICRARAAEPDAPPFVVVAPTSVVANWAAEARRFAPELRTLMITATEKRRGLPLDEACTGMDLVITSYALFRLEYDEYERLNWSGLLLDEAQHIKNHQSKGYQCARRLPAPFKLVITGTPMENNLMELWSMFSITAPGLLANPRRFTEHYRTPIERGGDGDRLAQLRARIRPLLMRRTKQEVVSDLPPKTEQVLELELAPRHRRVYQRYLQRERRKVLGLLGDLDRNRFEVFRSLTLLRQAALDATLVDDTHDGVPSTKLDALMETLTDITAEGHRVLVFSQFTRFLGLARQRLDAAGMDYSYLDGKTRDRAAVLDGFKNGTAPVFLISLKAGGVGLNLTEADYCIVLDPWWNPAAEQQAVDRAHRIGQQRPVVVYRMLAKDTIEDKVMALKARKAALFDSIMADGGVGSAGLTAADIRGLLD